MYIDRRINNSTWGGSARMCTSRAPLSWPFERNRLEAETTCVPLDVATIQTDLRRESSESSIAEVRRRSSNRQLRERRKNRTSHSLFLLPPPPANGWSRSLNLEPRGFETATGRTIDRLSPTWFPTIPRLVALCSASLFVFSNCVKKKKEKSFSNASLSWDNNYRGTVSKFVIALSKLVASFFFF